MRIQSINSELIAEIPFLNAGRGPGRYYVDWLPIHEAIVDKLPGGMAAIIVTADLQGREQFDKSSKRPPRLLGEVLPAQLTNEILPRLSLPNGSIGVLLAGDFYTVPALNKRGGSGDVSEVWRAFSDEFDWVAGVAGNHDTFGEDPNAAPHFSNGRIHYLDETRVNINGLKIAGLGGIIGNLRRMRRRSEDHYCRALENLLAAQTDVLLTHDGPNAPSQGYVGSTLVREMIEILQPRLAIRGHAHWSEPFVELEGGVQVLNVDARVVVLREFYL